MNYPNLILFYRDQGGAASRGDSLRDDQLG